MTIVELSLTDILVIRPQYQRIVRRTVAHIPNLITWEDQSQVDRETFEHVILRDPPA